MLLQILTQSKEFQKLTPPQREIFSKLAEKFESHPNAHILGLQDLVDQLGHSIDTWRRFLSLKPVQDYVNMKIRQDIPIYHRQALFQQAMKAIESGSSDAAKYIKELYNSITNEQNQTVIILHCIPRPADAAPPDLGQTQQNSPGTNTKPPSAAPTTSQSTTPSAQLSPTNPTIQ